MLSLQNLQNMMGLSGEGGGGGLNYLIQEEFTSADTAPLTDPRVAEPGPGSFDITNAANLSIAGGKLVGADGATAGLVSASAVTIGNGLAIKFDRTRAENSGIYAGLNSVQALPSGYTDLEYGFNGAVTIYTGEFVNDPNSIAVAKLAIIFDDTNVYYFANNTALGDVWTLLWVRAIKTTGSHYVVSAAATAAGDGDFEYIRAVDDFITSIFSESIDYENVGAYLFDGVDDVIEAANSAAITSLMASGGSVSFWLNPSSDGEGNDGYILNKEGDWRIVTTGESGGNIALRFIQRFSSTNAIWDTAVNIPIGSWTHFAVVYDNGATTNDPVFYVNGVSVAVTETDTPVGTAETNNTNDLNIGNWGGLTKAYDGYIRDVRLFDVSLTAETVGSIYNGEVIPQNPVRWYKCDEGSGTTATDEMGDVNGTITAGDIGAFHVETNNKASSLQTLGSEQITNGDFSAWTTDDPDNWTIIGESGSDPEVTERDPTQSHGDSVTTGGAANIYQSGTGTIRLRKANFFNTESWYEITYSITGYTSGTLIVGEPFGTMQQATAAGDYTILRNINQVGGSKELDFYLNGAAGDLTVDDVSVKAVTTNPVQTGDADGINDIFFTVPSTPTIGDAVHLLYRYQDADNYWDAYITYNGTNWDFKLDEYLANTRTNKVSVTGISAPLGIRVMARTSKHQCYTFDGTDYTARGSAITDTSLQTETDLLAIYTSGFTFASLRQRPVNDSSYDTIDTI